MDAVLVFGCFGELGGFIDRCCKVGYCKFSGLKTVYFYLSPDLLLEREKENPEACEKPV